MDYPLPNPVTLANPLAWDVAAQGLAAGQHDLVILAAINLALAHACPALRRCTKV